MSFNPLARDHIAGTLFLLAYLAYSLTLIAAAWLAQSDIQIPILDLQLIAMVFRGAAVSCASFFLFDKIRNFDTQRFFENTIGIVAAIAPFAFVYCVLVAVILHIDSNFTYQFVAEILGALVFTAVLEHIFIHHKSKPSLSKTA